MELHISVGKTWASNLVNALMRFHCIRITLFGKEVLMGLMGEVNFGNECWWLCSGEDDRWGGLSVVTRRLLLCTGFATFPSSWRAWMFWWNHLITNSFKYRAVVTKTTLRSQSGIASSRSCTISVFDGIDWGLERHRQNWNDGRRTIRLHTLTSYHLINQ